MNWNNMQTWHWFAIAGGAILILGVIVYFLPAGKLKIPAIVTTAVGGLCAGLALGIIYMGLLGYAPVNPGPGEGEATPEAANKGAPLALGKGGGGMPGGGQAKGKGKGKGGGGGFGTPPTPRVQLAILVNSLDSIVDKPVAVNLSPEDRAAIAKQLEGLEAAAEISEDDAKSKLQAIQTILAKDRKSMESVGYRWVTEGKSGFTRTPVPKDSPNPFKEGTPNEHLKSLLSRLEKK